jgi:hypothetical protein
MEDDDNEAGRARGHAARPLGPAADIASCVKRYPYRSVAGALGIGYALGGGIFTPLTSRLLRLGFRIGVRTALLPILKAELSDLAGAFTSRKDSSTTTNPGAGEGRAT